MDSQIIVCLILALFFFADVHSATITVKNNCPFTIWPATVADTGVGELATTGFELASTASFDINAAPSSWSGGVWARTGCSDSNGSFVCATADCGSRAMSCNGAGPRNPATLVELKLKNIGGEDLYDTTLVHGFNIPASITPQGGSGQCGSSACPVNVNDACPEELQVKGSDGRVIACNSACDRFGNPRYCCTDGFSAPDACPPSKYAEIFKRRCPNAYSYVYDEREYRFTCEGANYVITFCP